MVAIKAEQLARWFIKKNYDAPRNSKEGNMKLQKLLYFSQLVHLAKYNEPLFEEDICAFENGSVVEKVRHLYQYSHTSFVNSAIVNDIHLSSEQLETLQTVESLFGDLSAWELSQLNHLHQSWKDSYKRSKSGGYSWKAQSVITLEQMRTNELDNMKEIIQAYETGSNLNEYRNSNGRKFYYDAQSIELNEELLSMLESFDGRDSAYTIYKDETVGLIIY
ncbi:Uncharacterized phage-associated protein [Paenibacillus tianmuensis]|uniref:Uncharacterized phage-associated protein n=1 Tax=Paenibacillus tianmuensis TaxID=624147 RepID=A0A1G4RMR6_9BACL|nr:type II toxin-antitoxin system antitoxin SocA domain-containing protein [Paenibacillus tianmuensis]SCW57469.1 Uncharacterized phage-associated protein [Paenibacillus tianmuensis]